MRYFVKELGKRDVTLTCYLHHLSDELKNVEERSAVLIFPGGGYAMCSDREAEPVALSYLAEGYQAFVLRYSVGEHTSFEDAFADAVKALQYLRDHAEELHICKEKIAITGFSAGGHLAAAVATKCSEKPAALILGYPCILASMSPLLNKEVPGIEECVTTETPPTFIFATSDDATVPVENSLKFALALSEKNVEFELHIYRKGRHGLSLAKTHTSNGSSDRVNETVAQWFQASVTWLNSIYK